MLELECANMYTDVDVIETSVNSPDDILTLG